MSPPPQLSLDTFGIVETVVSKNHTKPMKTKEKREMKKFVNEMMYVIHPPMIVPPGYENSINPDWEAKRMLNIMQEQKQIFEKEWCCEFDAMIYISFCSLMAKPSHEAGRIYEYLFDKFYDYSMISDYPAPTLDYHEHDLLVMLRRWIFKRQMEHLKTK